MAYFGYDKVMRLPNNPTIYEVHTSAYLHEFAPNGHSPITLDAIPDQELDRLVALGVDAVWLMGVWQRSEAAARIDAANVGLQTEFRNTLPDFIPSDAIGSAYAIRDYTVDARFGGNDALARLRERMAARGIGLILDFVPNHTAPDHTWVREHVDYYIHVDRDAALREPDAYALAEECSIAKGRDPNSAPWPDVLQMNAFSPGYRAATIETLGRIASMSDGVRCDMAMLMLDDVVQRTWGQLAGEPLATTYWQQVTRAVREQYPDYTFIAECYWDTERTLIEQGFDYCYDKTLYDHLVANDPTGAKEYLARTADIQPHMVHFIENHDEPRAAARLRLDQALAAGAIMATLPGANLIHHGQIEGKRVKIPVQLSRGPNETPNPLARASYSRFYKMLNETGMRTGRWSFSESDDTGIITYEWRSNDSRVMFAVNYTNSTFKLALPLGANHNDLVNAELIGAELETNKGISVDIPPWQLRTFSAID